MKKDLKIIIIVYILTHSFLFLLTGTFWDDWCYVSRNVDTLWSQFLQAGIPSRALIIQAVWNIPNFGYRGVVFFLFLFICVLFYLILHNISLFDDRSCLYISLLFIVIPLNDCRVILCDVPYTFGLFSFFVGFYLLTIWEKEFRHKYLLRLFILVCFFISFTINSLLFFYIIVLIYLYVLEYKKCHQFLKALKYMLYYFDFMIIPLLFFGGKQLLFPVYGLYATYNSLTLQGLINAVIMLPLGIFRQFHSITCEFYNWIAPSWVTKDVNWLIVLFFLMVLLCKIIRKFDCFCTNGTNKYIKKLAFSEIESKEITRDIICLILGVFVFAIGMYPYLAIRGSITLATDGVASRDSMLLPIGMSIVIYFAFKIIIDSQRIFTYVIIFVIVLGVCSFNVDYLDYQRDSYWQSALTEKFCGYPQLSDKTNLLFLTDDENGIGGTRFYTLNGNAALVYNNEKRLIMNGYSDLERLHSERLEMYVNEINEYGMNDYDLSNKKLDGIIIYSNQISYRTTIELKLYELFNPSKYGEIIKNMGTFAYYDINSIEAKELLSGYEY